MIDFIIKYWVGVIMGGIVTGFTLIVKRILKDKKEHCTIKNGIQALLRDRIIHSYNHYKEKDNCPIYALENIDKMYNEYKELGGNGTITQLVGELKEMPHN